jgi:hypothetical protein
MPTILSICCKTMERVSWSRDLQRESCCMFPARAVFSDMMKLCVAHFRHDTATYQTYVRDPSRTTANCRAIRASMAVSIAFTSYVEPTVDGTFSSLQLLQARYDFPLQFRSCLNTSIRVSW